MYRPTLLIYGATGHSGRLIVAEATAQGIFDIIVAGRNAAGLAELAQTYPQAASRVLALQNDVELIQALEHVDIVLNAAGPFNRTALPLLRGCLQAGCDYLDICGEIDVYESLYKCWAATGNADISVVCGVGYTGAATDILAAAALADLRQSGAAGHDRRLSSMRVCYSELSALTAGSIATALRMLTRYVTVSDAHVQAPHSPSHWTSTLVRHPVGRLERYFEFLPGQHSLGNLGALAAPRRCLGSAASLVDTPMLRQTTEAAGFAIGRIASYIELSGWQRLGYQTGALVSRLGQSRWAAAAVSASACPALPLSPHSIVLEIDSEFDEALIRWQLDVDDVYAFSARIAMAAAATLGAAGPRQPGWWTPASVLGRGTGFVEQAFVGSCVQRRTDGPLAPVSCL